MSFPPLDLTISAPEQTALSELQQAYQLGAVPGTELAGPARAQLEVSVPTHPAAEGVPAVDLGRLRSALEVTSRQHPMLRARMNEGGPWIQDDPLPGFVVRDRRGSGTAVEVELDRLRTDRLTDPEQAAPLDLVAILLDNEVRLLVTADLRFLDLPSLGQVLAEIRTAHDGAPTRAASSGSFVDHLNLQQQERSGQRGAAAARYWEARLDDIPSPPELPVATTPQQLSAPRWTHRQHVLDRNAWARFSQQAEARALRPESVLLAAWAEVLTRWSATSASTLTRTLDSRRPGWEQVVGQFSTPSLTVVEPAPYEPFSRRVATLQHRLDLDAEHALHTGFAVLRELTRRRSRGRVSAPVVFSSLLDGAGADGLSALGPVLALRTHTPQVWLENQVIPLDGGVILTWNAVEELFPVGVLDDMFDSYRDLLTRLGEEGHDAWQQDGSLAQLPRTQVLEQHAANHTAVDLAPRRLHDLVLDAARTRTQAVAVVDVKGATSYGELQESAHRIAQRLHADGPLPADHLVAVCMSAGADQIAAILGVLEAGAAYVCLDPSLPDRRRHSLLRRCQVRTVVADAAARDELEWPEDVAVITPHDAATLNQAPDPLEGGRTLDDLAYVIFTSGSTGEPKGVMITHRSAANTVQDVNRRFAVSEVDRVLALAPTGFDLSVYDIFGVLGAGGAIVVPDPSRASDPAHWTELVREHRVTLWNSVPAPVRMWVDALESDTQHGDADAASNGLDLRLVLMSGDWIPTDLPGRLRAILPAAEVISLGGATEGSIWSIGYPIGAVDPRWPSIPYGKALANQTMYVLNAGLEPTPTWVTGEIHIGGLGVARGYWAEPERTAERFFHHPVTGERLYRTGDLGRQLPGGDIEILGRIDNQVKINGYRVELGEVEACLTRTPGVRDAVVTAPQHPRTGQRQLAAHLVLDAVIDDPTILREVCTATLPAYMVPHRFLRIEAIPLTANGKVDHGALPTPWDGEDVEQEGAAGADDVQLQLVEIWSSHLGHTEFGLTDGYFDVGGDSLHAVGILRDVRQAFDVTADVEQELVESLFMNADVATFASIVRTA